MNKAAFGDIISTYHIEGAIAYEHRIAQTFDKTNWRQILVYYDLLVKLHPTAVVMLNRMTVVYKIKGGEQTLPELNQSPYLKEWEKHYLYHSLLGEIYSEKNKAKAKKSFEKAITLTKSDAEKKLLKHKIEQL